MAHPSAHAEVLAEVRRELERLGASVVKVRIDDKFEPEVGALLHVEFGGAYWHLLPENFLALLRQLPPRAGGEAIKQAIEKHGSAVWHGPAPEGSRDASPS